MAPRSVAYRQLQQRMRRTLNYGTRRMSSLSLPLSELVVNYFDKHAPFDYMKMDFATSLARESCVDACTFLVAMVYVDRVRNTDKIHFEASDPNEVYLSALVVASKYLYDGGLTEFVYNDEWAASASTSVKRVNFLELSLLDALSWNINVDEEEFARVLKSAEEWVAKDFIDKRGFITYNEASILSDRINFYENFLKPFLITFTKIVIIYSAFTFSILFVPRISVLTPTNESKVVFPKVFLDNGLSMLNNWINKGSESVLRRVSQINSRLFLALSILYQAQLRNQEAISFNDDRLFESCLNLNHSSLFSGATALVTC